MVLSPKSASVAAGGLEGEGMGFLFHRRPAVTMMSLAAQAYVTKKRSAARHWPDERDPLVGEPRREARVLRQEAVTLSC